MIGNIDQALVDNRVLVDHGFRRDVALLDTISQFLKALNFSREFQKPMRQINIGPHASCISKVLKAIIDDNALCHQVLLADGAFPLKVLNAQPPLFLQFKNQIARLLYGLNNNFKTTNVAHLIQALDAKDARKDNGQKQWRATNQHVDADCLPSKEPLAESFFHDAVLCHRSLRLKRRSLLFC